MEHLDKGLISYLEDGMNVGSSTATRMSVSGSPYLTLTSGGFKGEGDKVPAVYSHPQKAIDAFIDQFMWYRKNKKTLYWRRHPAIDEVAYETERGEDVWYVVTCRVLAE